MIITADKLIILLFPLFFLLLVSLPCKNPIEFFFKMTFIRPIKLTYIKTIINRTPLMRKVYSWKKSVKQDGSTVPLTLFIVVVVVVLFGFIFPDVYFRRPCTNDVDPNEPIDMFANSAHIGFTYRNYLSYHAIQCAPDLALVLSIAVFNNHTNGFCLKMF